MKENRIVTLTPLNLETINAGEMFSMQFANGSEVLGVTTVRQEPRLIMLEPIGEISTIDFQFVVQLIGVPIEFHDNYEYFSLGIVQLPEITAAVFWMIPVVED